MCLDFAVETAGIPIGSNDSTVDGDLGTLMVPWDVCLGSSGLLSLSTFGPLPLRVRSHAGILAVGKPVTFCWFINLPCRFLFFEGVRLTPNRKERSSLVLTFEA